MQAVVSLKTQMVRGHKRSRGFVLEYATWNDDSWHQNGTFHTGDIMAAVAKKNVRQRFHRIDYISGSIIPMSIIIFCLNEKMESILE